MSWSFSVFFWSNRGPQRGERSTPRVPLILPEVGSHRASFLFARHNLKFMSSRIGYTRLFSPFHSLTHSRSFSLLFFTNSIFFAFLIAKSRFLNDVLPPLNLNIKIRQLTLTPSANVFRVSLYITHIIKFPARYVSIKQARLRILR